VWPPTYTEREYPVKIDHLNETRLPFLLGKR
jgi:hypothetical protein